MVLLLKMQFLLGFVIGGGVTWYLLYRRNRDPWFGALAAAVIAGLGGIVGIIILMVVWIWIYYFMPPGVPTVIKIDKNERKRFKIKW